MTLVVKYPSKKEMKEHVGKPLRYIETSLFGEEYRANGVLTVANRPHITGQGREFFANVTMKDGVIAKVI
jgi:NADH:ubiquinone oxidoreductase subunit F (NADH-binding)